jgi:hypothetical protein
MDGRTRREGSRDSNGVEIVSRTGPGTVKEEQGGTELPGKGMAHVPGSKGAGGRERLV